MRLLKNNSAVIKWPVVIGIVSLVCMFVWYIMGIHRELLIQWFYSNPLVITFSYAIFRIFERLNIKNNRIVISLSKASLTTYLLHGVFFGIIRIPYYVKSTTYIMIVHLVISTIFIFMICYVTHIIFDFVMTKVFTFIENKIFFLKEDIYSSL